MAARKSVLLILALCCSGIGWSLSCCRCCWCCWCNRCRINYCYSNSNCLAACFILLAARCLDTDLDLVSSCCKSCLYSELAVLFVDREFLFVLVDLNDLVSLLAAGILHLKDLALIQNCLLSGSNSRRNCFHFKFCLFDCFFLHRGRRTAA